MREIKFRAWDKENEKMIQNYAHVSKYGQFYTAWTSTDREREYIPMQYTGLKDKNGKEIFEGDVIPIVIEDLGESIKTVNGVVKFQRGQWNIEYLHPFQKEMYLANLYSLLERAEKEVIGNLYENPELLDK